jgi:hypothetical protein
MILTVELTALLMKPYKLTHEQYNVLRILRGGKVDTVVGFVQDITEFRLSQIENEYYHEKMEQLMFQSSHHLRASVSTILGVVELFKTNRMKPEEFQIFLKYISDAATEADESLRYICRKLQEGKSSQ